MKQMFVRASVVLEKRFEHSRAAEGDRAMAEPARASGEDKKEEQETMSSPPLKENAEIKKRSYEAEEDSLGAPAFSSF